MRQKSPLPALCARLRAVGTETRSSPATSRLASEEASLDPRQWQRTLFDALIEQAEDRPKAVALEDQERTPLTFNRLLLGALVLGRKIADLTQPGERVGVLLPNVNAAGVTLFALFAYGRVAAMLNFTAGASGLISAIETIEARLVVTSRRFVGIAKLEEKIAALSQKATVVYLEDIRASVGFLDRIRGLLQSRRAAQMYRRYRPQPDDVAVILFTSGTEQLPKAVALTHANILANVEQARVAIGCTSDDVLLNPLPVFHAFGLTAGLLLPVVVGFRCVLSASPLQYEAVPELARECGATILLGIDTFANGWGRAAAPDDFRSLRLVVLGAERVKDATRRLWSERFGIEICEGYGVTEAAPVRAVNRPGYNRIGTVGPLLAGIEMRLEEVEGIEHAKRLFVRGPNIMAGYYLHDRPGVLVPPKDGWHDTGDLVTLDEAGAVTIVGRAKRFAKVAGEMISLGAAETLVAQSHPDGVHAVVAVPDPRKGEALVLVTTAGDIDLSYVRKAARQAQVSDLAVPSRVITVDEMPLLGNGKTDYLALERLAAVAQLV